MKEEERCLYLSYGTHMLQEYIKKETPSANFYGLGKLYNYQLQFVVPDTDSDVTFFWHGGIADIKPGHGHVTWGVVWELSTTDLKTLESSLPGHVKVKVQAEIEGHLQECWVYHTENETMSPALPGLYYKQILVAGARQHSLPDDYVEFLQKTPHNGNLDMPELYKELLNYRRHSI